MGRGVRVDLSAPGASAKTSRMTSVLIRAAACAFVVLTGSVRAEPALDPAVSEVLRVVEDADGFTNLRAAPGTNAKVVGKALSGAVIAIEPGAGKSGWHRVAPELSDEEQWIHGSRLRKLEGWRGADAAGKGGEKEATVTLEDVVVRVGRAPFRAAEHEVTPMKDGRVLVDRLAPWGQDGGLPWHGLTLSVRVGGVPVKLPPRALKNLFEPNPESLLVLRPAKKNGQFVVVMVNGDGAGGYCVAWSFRDGAYVSRAVCVPY